MEREWRETTTSVSVRKYEAQGTLGKTKHEKNRTGLLSKPQCMKTAKSLEIWDKNWRRRGEIKLEENARKDQERACRHIEKKFCHS